MNSTVWTTRCQRSVTAAPRTRVQTTVLLKGGLQLPEGRLLGLLVLQLLLLGFLLLADFGLETTRLVDGEDLLEEEGGGGGPP